MKLCFSVKLHYSSYEDIFMADTKMLNTPAKEQINLESLETANAATQDDLVNLAEKLTQGAVPLKVLLQALNIATYDKAAAFRYANQYLNKTKKHKWVLLKNPNRVTSSIQGLEYRNLTLVV